MVFSPKLFLVFFPFFSKLITYLPQDPDPNSMYRYLDPQHCLPFTVHIVRKFHSQIVRPADLQRTFFCQSEAIVCLVRRRRRLQPHLFHSGPRKISPRGRASLSEKQVGKYIYIVLVLQLVLVLVVLYYIYIYKFVNLCRGYNSIPGHTVRSWSITCISDHRALRKLEKRENLLNTMLY